MVALSAYTNDTQLLLNDTAAVIYTAAELTGYINKARNQIAGSSETARAFGALSTAAGAESYPLATVTFSAGGLASAINIRSACIVGSTFVELWPWERFHDNALSVNSAEGPPQRIAVYNPGINGSVYLDPVPDGIYHLTFDCVCLPSPLTNPTDNDFAISFPWTDAVGYYAAHLALLRTGRIADARAMFEMYQMFERRAVEMTGASRTIDSYSPTIGQELAAARHPLTQPGASQRGGR